VPSVRFSPTWFRSAWLVGVAGCCRWQSTLDFSDKPDYVLSTSVLNYNHPGPNHVAYLNYKPFSPNFAYVRTAVVGLGSFWCFVWVASAPLPSPLHLVFASCPVSRVLPTPPPPSAVHPPPSPPAYTDVVDYMAAMPAANFSGLPVAIDTPVYNTSGFLMNPSLVVDAKSASRAGLSLLDEYLLSVRVRACAGVAGFVLCVPVLFSCVSSGDAAGLVRGDGGTQRVTLLRQCVCACLRARQLSLQICLRVTWCPCAGKLQAVHVWRVHVWGGLHVGPCPL
jgi:hypothetical protein